MSDSPLLQMKPFLWTGLSWILVGSGVIYGTQSSGASIGHYAWYLLFWALSMADLGTIGALVYSMLIWEGFADKARLGIRIAVLILLKLSLLLIFGAILFQRHGIPHSSLLLGLGTLIVVPLVGGLAWSFQGKSLKE